MKKITLHIGMHKTATTSIQSALAASAHLLEKESAHYASFTEVNHSIPMYTIFSHDRENYHIWRRAGVSPSDVNQKRLRYIEILEKDIENKRFKNLIISGEDLSMLLPDEQEEVCEFFRTRDCTIEVVYVVRAPGSFALSSIQETAKGGYTTDFFKVDPLYKRRLIGYFNALQKDNISILKFENLIKNKGVIENFGNFLGLKLIETARKNEAVTSEGLRALFALNNIKTKTLGDPGKIKARGHIVNAIFTNFTTENGCQKLTISQSGNCFDWEVVRSDFDWLYKNFGIDYSEIKTAEIERNVNASSEKVYYECMQRLFANFDTVFTPNNSIEEQLNELFLNINPPELTTQEIDQLRDTALKISKNGRREDIVEALFLMELALKYRPSGPMIKMKIAEFKSFLQDLDWKNGKYPK